MQPAVSRPVAVVVILIVIAICAVIWHFEGPNSKHYRARMAAAAAKTVKAPRLPNFQTTWPEIPGLENKGAGLYFMKAPCDWTNVESLVPAIEKAGLRFVYVTPPDYHIIPGPDFRPLGP